MPNPPDVAVNVPCDLTSDQDVRDAFQRVRDERGERIASVVHLAAYYDFSGEPSDLYEKVTVQGTRRMLENLRDFHAEQFIFSSTMLVHAPTEPGKPITEMWPLEPKWDYPKSKVRTENLIRDTRGDVPAVMLRIAGVYNDAGHSIPLVHQMQRIAERWMVGHVFPGDTSHGQAFVHLDDVVEAIRLTVLRRADLAPEMPILIGEVETLSYDTLQREFGRLIHGEEDWKTTRIPKAVAKAGAWVQDVIPGVEEPFIKPWMIDLADDHYELDIARARCHLGWEPSRNLRDTLPKMVQRMKADPAGWGRENDLSPPPSKHANMLAAVGSRAE
jgi:nucleoside-diphosphate-sugar epimerase